MLRASPPKERADAARNRLAALEVAASRFAEHGVEQVRRAIRALVTALC